MSTEPRVVYKYPLTQRMEHLKLPPGAVFRHLDVVAGAPVLWIERPADPQPGQEDVWVFRVVATGQVFPAGQQHLGSARCADTGLVWHVYRTNAPADQQRETS